MGRRSDHQFGTRWRMSAFGTDWQTEALANTLSVDQMSQFDPFVVEVEDLAKACTKPVLLSGHLNQFE